ncbi:helix-turn-helix transcriptional regulator [Bacillus toyonensis]|uniref:Transcriptional regulator n=2 Tax=Bacillus toyonensis TaxID=155322 RepID=A0AB73QRY5_9BACI|nr:MULTISPECIES: helix-turn-helix transcriptional regulator [Bacillus]KAF6547519.1 helix-turn-helix transcriptional regulator [Bacillus sp. EKM202B]MBC2686446.1 helix-turn-helix transcriptional regulator [Bacillus toyonensis]MBJ8067849.1 helix-turn-helix transcriptional regulator [Bacillus cereus group sp. N15]NKW97301.1 helix-turn-helix transcriptional regulator [Bacillus toyonensis]PDY52992.1 transcriptional regulator [Bacillus toyonensis]
MEGVINLEKLKQRRMEKGWTCEEVANKVGITKMHYWYIENSKRNLKIDLAVKIANAFEDDPKDLFFK